MRKRDLRSGWRGERLAIPADVTFNIEHERTGSDEELEFQLLWKRH